MSSNNLPKNRYLFALRYAARRLLVNALTSGLIAIALLLLLIYLRGRTIILPVPSGELPVGRIRYDWNDPNRMETERPRQLTVWIWYPSDPQPTDMRAEYLPSAWRAARDQENGLTILMQQDLSVVQTHAYSSPPLSTATQRYPVLIFMPGLGPLVTDYTTLLEDLASQGYIVVGVNPAGNATVVLQTGEVLPRDLSNVPSNNASPSEANYMLNNLILTWVGDINFTFHQLEYLNLSDPDNRFTSHLDLEHVGVFGHSFGGAASAQALARDTFSNPAFAAGLDLDGYPYGSVVQTGISRPFLFFWNEPIDSADLAWQQAMANAHTMLAPLDNDGYQFILSGARHFDMSDFAIFYNPFMRLNGLLGSIDGRRSLAITSAYICAFFDHYLKALPAPLLDDSPHIDYPEVKIIKP